MPRLNDVTRALLGPAFSRGDKNHLIRQDVPLERSKPKVLLSRNQRDPGLEDSSDPLSETFLTQGGYPARPEYDREATKILSKKIVKYGIIRETILDGG